MEALRAIRRVKLHLHLERQRHRTTRDVLHAAIALLVERNQQIDRLRNQNRALRDELRRGRVA